MPALVHPRRGVNVLQPKGTRDLGPPGSLEADTASGHFFKLTTSEQSGFAAIWPDLLYLGVFVMFALSTALFQRTL